MNPMTEQHFRSGPEGRYAAIRDQNLIVARAQ